MKLTDKQIEEVAMPFITSVGDYGCSERAIPDNGKIEEFARAIIAAEDAERLKDVTPLRMQLTLMGNPIGITPDFYSADTVSALIGRIAELEAMLTQMIACHGEETCPAVEMAKELLKAKP